MANEIKIVMPTRYFLIPFIGQYYDGDEYKDFYGVLQYAVENGGYPARKKIIDELEKLYDEVLITAPPVEVSKDDFQTWDQ